MSEGFGDLPLTDLDLSHCGSLDQVATLQLIIEKFQGLTKLALRSWKITDLTEGSIFYSTLFLILNVRRLWTVVASDQRCFSRASTSSGR